MEDHLNYDKFNLNTLCEFPIITTIGRRGTGKTWINLKILNYLDQDTSLNKIIIYSPTERMNALYSVKFHTTKNLTIKHTLNEQELKNIIEDQINNPDQKIILVLDDAFGPKYKNKYLSDIIKNNKDYRITLLMTFQFPIRFKKPILNKFDYIFLLNEDFLSNIKRINKQYANTAISTVEYDLHDPVKLFSRFKFFEPVFTALTQKFEAMVINKRVESSDVKKKIFWFKI